MASSVSFRASARTVDHLGKGQIADTPTAVSELWKNSYDAYATKVALHTFDGPYQCAAVFDNGCGMTLDQIINSWLVIGTNVKTNKEPLPKEDRFGLDIRMTQGEKGIGRLSAAFLAPVTFLITKKVDSEFSAVLIDWRFFENPYLSLSDINIPLRNFESLESLKDVYQELVSELEKNLCFDSALKSNKDIDSEDRKAEKIEGYESRIKRKEEIRKLRIRRAWHLLSIDEANANKSENTTEELIKKFCRKFKFNSESTNAWESYLTKAKEDDSSAHGTCMLLLDINRELSLLTNRKDKSNDDFEVNGIRESLVDTLKAFIDPFERQDFKFDYEIKSFSGSLEEKMILNNLGEISYEDFLQLEHRVEGIIDERGWFVGNVVAFGKDLGEFKYPPSIGFDNNSTKVGKFRIRLGAIEQKGLSVLDEETNDTLATVIEKDHGIMIFRDGLRVQPYGRVDNDFFQIEERRGKNAGRHFWANRRMIGQISLDQINNSNLKDKAGREGFIRNQAARELRELVISHLINFADKHFGRNSDVRKIRHAIVEKEKEAKKSAQKKARRQSQKSFKESLIKQRPVLESKLSIARELYNDLQEEMLNSLGKLEQLVTLSTELEQYRGELKTPSKPAKLNQKLEGSYREYRDLYAEFSELMRVSQSKLNHFEATYSTRSPFETAKRYFDSKQGLLNRQISKYEKLLLNKVKELEIEWKRDASEDRSLFYNEAVLLLEETKKENLETQLNAMEAVYLNLADDSTIKYDSLLRAVDKLNKGINLDSAFSMAEEERVHFEEKAKQLKSLAQLGISVEILAHELEQQDHLVTRGLNSLPSDVKVHPGFTTAYNAHKQLTSHIRFLSPLKLSGYQSRQDIDGAMIEEHIRKFFRNRFENQRVSFSVSESFKTIVVRDLPSRIYPVFVNIINNAMYWVCLNQHREITIEVKNDLVIIGNSGPAVDEDDIPKLFDLFYSKRSNGHGVGLYLCKENLAVAHHRIWYVVNSEEKVFNSGANFAIKFNGMEFK